MVVICGAANLYNDAICYALSRELDIGCRIVESPKEITESSFTDCQDPRSLLLVDGSTGCCDAIVAELRRRMQATRHRPLIAIHNLSRGQEIPADLLQHEVRGLFYVEDGLTHFVRGIRALFQGEASISGRAHRKGVFGDQAQRLAVLLDCAGLTRRQAQILAQVSSGANDEEIAGRLRVSRHTVKHHLHAIYRRLDIHNRFQAVLWMTKNGR